MIEQVKIPKYKTRLYRTWGSMKQRCYNTKNIGYKRYGGKGVTVCDEWKSDFESFKSWSMKSGYSDELTIDRIDFNGNYEPLNCQWVTMAENQKESTQRNLKNSTGAFSKESFRKVEITNKKRLGKKFLMYSENEEVTRWECLKDCAEYICSLGLGNMNSFNVKKNISACLLGKRKSCLGFTFKTIEQNHEDCRTKKKLSERKVGVTFDKRMKKYKAYITVKGKYKTLGFFKEYEDAVCARKEAEVFYKEDRIRETKTY